MIYDWSQIEGVAQELNGKTVEFKVPLEQGGINFGKGKFRVYRDNRGQLLVVIDQPISYPNGALGLNRVAIPFEESSKVLKNSPSSECEYNLMAV